MSSEGASPAYPSSRPMALKAYRAARHGNVSVAQSLIQDYLHKVGNAADFFVNDLYGESDFGLWSLTGKKEIVALLKPYGVPWNPVFAVRWGELAILQDLLRDEPDRLLSFDHEAHSLLYWSLHANQLPVASWLLGKGFDMKNTVENYVYVALRSRDESVIRFAVENGAPVDGPPGSRTALHHECNHGWTKLVPCLLRLGADPNTPDPSHDGNTALHLAARHPRAGRLVKLLIEGGANVDTKNDLGESALDLAKKVKNSRVREVLLDFGAE